LSGAQNQTRWARQFITLEIGRIMIVVELNVGVVARIHPGYAVVAAYIEARICKHADNDTPWRYTVRFVMTLYCSNA